MEEKIIESSLLTFEKSNFLLELKQIKEGDQYLSITQTTNKGAYYEQTLNINPKYVAVLISEIKALLDNKELIKKETNQKGKIFKIDANSIVNNYLKGVPAKDLAMINDCTEEDIENILIENNIPIINHIKPEIEKYRRRKRNKRY